MMMIVPIMMMLMRMLMPMIMRMTVPVIMRMTVLMIMRMTVLMIMRMIYGRSGTHCTPPSPFINTFNNSESELRIAVVLSSKIFLYDSSVRTSL